jgi:signal transduction histidine kinase
MGALMRATDWSKTGLGPVETWPTSLHTMLGVMLGSRFPMLLWWGPDLLHLYNDAYRPILRDKHPASLAAPAAEVWAEVWDVAGPMARSVLAGGPATWTEDLQLFINSGTMAEETYFTFSYSPIPGDDGRVAGVLNTVQETTTKVQGERQIRMLHDLAARAGEARSRSEAFRIATETLSSNPLDLPFALLYAFDQQANGLTLAAASGWSDDLESTPPAFLHLDRAAPTISPITEVLRTARETVMEDLVTWLGPLPAGRWNASSERAIVMPLLRAGGGQAPYGVLVAGLSPHRAFDDRYRSFFRATADQVMTVIANAGAYEAEKKRAEALAEIDRAKTIFFSNVSHEFRTPLTLMLGPTEDALGSADRALTGESLQIVHRNTLRLLRLVNSLLDFSRIESGRMQASYQPTDLSAMTTDLASMFRAAVERAGLAFEIDCQPLPELIYLDHDQWEKIVLNLLSNALKFTFEGSIGVSVRLEGDHVALEVRDTGVGIPEDELPHLFERFHQVRGTKSRTHEGSGIGLALVRDLTRLHGGAVRVASRLGVGTTFTVSIPRGSAHLSPDRISERATPWSARGSISLVEDAARWSGGSPALVSQPAPPAGAAQRPGGGRILVVDDNADLRDYLVQLLRDRYTVETAVDGLAALAAARGRKPDLILSDVMMPELDGFGLLRAVRADPDLRDVSVILISARAGEESTVEGLEVGADDYLAKPFAARELLARIQTQIELAHHRRELAELNRLLTGINQELARATQAKTDFLSMMTHELRTPLNAIMGFSEVLIEGKGGAVNERQMRYLRHIHDGGQHLLTLINDLLDLSKVEAGLLDVVPEPCDPVDLVSTAITTLQQVAANKQVTLGLDPDHGAVPRLVADPLRVTQALYNLLSNAIKFTPAKGRVSVSITQPGADRLRITVRDTGPGIPPEAIGNLFKRFSQLANARGAGPGTGLGLALTKQLVELMGGEVGVESTVGVGSSFFVELPIRPGESIAAPKFGADHNGDAPLALVVDDDAAARELLELTLQGAGYRVRQTSSGEQALVYARQLRPAVITLDVLLPGIDGWEVLRSLREDPTTAEIPVVLVSISGDRKKAFGLGVLEHLVKPVDRQGLIDALERRGFVAKAQQRTVNVLVVDDDPAHLELVGATLEPKGFKVTTASTGRDGLAAARGGAVDLLLLDVVLPDVSGVEVVQSLRRDGATRDIPILLVTGHDLSAADRQRINGDVAAILAKTSLDIDALPGEIARVVRAVA